MNLKTPTKESVFLIAEIGGNHGGNLQYAKKLALLAKEHGADAVKFQTYTGDKLVNQTLDPERVKHFDNMKLSLTDFIELAEYCTTIGVEFMSSVWDEKSLEIINPYLTRHKLGSGDLTNYKMISSILDTGKPLILSTAMASMSEVQQAIKFIKISNTQYDKLSMLTVLHCVAMYGNPDPDYANLGFMDRLKKEFPGLTVGYSDHVRGHFAVIAAIARGAECIEVHFTDNKDQEFRDHHLSVLPEELKTIRNFADEFPRFFITPECDLVGKVETAQRIEEFRRAVYLNRDFIKGDVVQEKDLVMLRPFQGIGAQSYKDIIGKKCLININALEVLNYEMFGDH